MEQRTYLLLKLEETYLQYVFHPNPFIIVPSGWSDPDLNGVVIDSATASSWGEAANTLRDRNML